jgi:Na+-transporting methylmalonyl-CoA/oxaloacetate decarboxylase gamma subunit
VWMGQVSETFAQGLQITLLGMLLVFFTLGLVILALVALTHLPWSRVKSAQRLSPPNRTPTSRDEPEEVREPAPEEDLAQVAAVAVALLRSRHRPRRQVRPRAPTGTWKSYGRAHQIGL